MPINYKDYPPNWQQIRARILEREEHCCKICRVPNYAIIYRPFPGKPDWALLPEGHWGDEVAESFKVVKIILTVAHLDHDPENWQVKDERLAALCQYHHLNYDRPGNVTKFKYGRNFKINQLKIF